MTCRHEQNEEEVILIYHDTGNNECVEERITGGLEGLVKKRDTYNRSINTIRKARGLDIVDAIDMQSRCANMSMRIAELEVEKAALEKETANLVLIGRLRDECIAAQKESSDLKKRIKDLE